MISNLLRWSAVASALLGISVVACGGAPGEGEGTNSSSEALRPIGICDGTFVGGRCCPPGMFCPPPPICLDGECDPPPPPPPPPPHQVTSWSHTTLTNASSNPDWCKQNGYAPAAFEHEVFPDTPPWSNSADRVDQVQIALMGAPYNCSTPIRYSTYRHGSTDPGKPKPGTCNVTGDPNSYDYAFMYMQLCPYAAGAQQQALGTALKNLGKTMKTGECMLPIKPYQADFEAHASTTACTIQLPLAPAGYAWAITAADPTCPAGAGCMSSGGTSGGPDKW